MTPNAEGTMARTHLTAAAESLRVASERLCDYVKATMGDINSAPNADTGGARSVPTPPPIPRGAVVGYHEWTGDAWAHRLVHAPNGEARCVSPDDDLHFALTALYHARRERDAWRDDAQRYAANADFWRDRAEAAERERDAARRALRSFGQRAADWQIAQDNFDRESMTAILHDLAALASPAPAADRQSGGRLDASAVSDPAPLSGAGNMADSGNQAPAPASAPRRWWLVLDRSGALRCWQTCAEEAEWDANYYGRQPNHNGPYTVVPVVEARVTRETVAKVTQAIYDNRHFLALGGGRPAIAALSVLGLTVEGE